MRLDYLSAQFGVLLATAACGSGRRLAARDNVDLLSVVKGGVLVKNGSLTSCDLAVIDCRLSVVPASCLDYTSNTNLNSDTKYDVYYDDGLDGKVAHYSVDSVTVHPDFNPSTHVNDLALLQYNTKGEITWQNPISPISNFTWKAIGYMRGVPRNLTNSEWDGFNYDFGKTTHDDRCDDMSEMYAMNSKDMVCTNWTTDALSTDFNLCPIPYGTAYGIANDQAYLIGPYTFTAVNAGDSLCSYGTERSYYTALANYIKFITDTIGRSLLIDNNFFGANVTTLNAGYKMVDRDFIADNGLNTTKIGGNFYANQKSGSGLGPSSGEPEFSNQPGQTIDEVSAIDANKGTPEDNSGGLSRKNTIIVAVCVSIGGSVLIGVALFFAFWHWRRRREMTYPVGQARYQDMIESELGGATAHGDPRASEHTAVNEAPTDPALITAQAAQLLSASCLDYTSGITLNSNTKYDIYLDQGMDGVGLHRNVDSITVHPSYNPKTFVNDIAIMQFNTNEEIIWQNAIAPVLHYSWNVIGLIRGKPSNLNQLKWEGFSYSLPQLTTNSTCTGLSEMYEANSNDLMCSHEVHDAIVLSNYTCPVPYGTAFGIINGTAHLIGPYSYTAVEGGSDLCSFTDQRSYFISLANYLKFITTTINRDVRIDSLFQFDTSKLDADYKMVDRDFKDNNGMLSTKISGDFYNRRSTTSNVNSSSESDTSLDSTTSEKSGDSSS
ncbi:hypothetical protein H4S01_001535, partial [Coemansia sp. RSA 2610]